MAHQRPKKIGVLDVIPFGGSTYHLWQCRECGHYFAAAERTEDVMLVGLIEMGSVYRENRRLNRVRAQWAAARERGDVCTCAYRADWPTSELLHVRLAESRDEDSPFVGRLDQDETKR